MGKFGFAKKAKAPITSLMVVKTAGTPERLGGFYTATTIAFVDGAPSTITDSDNLFLKKMFKAGMYISITGAANPANNITYRIASVTAGTITLAAGVALTNEIAGATVVITCLDNIFVKSLTIQSIEANTGNVAIGNSSVLVSTGNGEVITPLNSVSMEGVYLQDIYVDVAVNGEAVSVTYEQVKTLN